MGLFLPKLKTDANVPPVSQEGRWETFMDDDFLRLLAEGLDVEKGVADEALTAIPTVWARPILFAQALFDEKHPLHEQITGEWRGLLTLFCLYNNLDINYQINVSKIELNERWALRVGKNDREREAIKNFLEVLISAPTRGKWDYIYTIKVNFGGESKLIGATSPLSLFFTPSNYDVPDYIPWRKKLGTVHILCDPLEYLIKNHKYELISILYNWISQIVEILRDRSVQEVIERGDVEAFDGIIKAFNGWRDDVLRKCRELRLDLERDQNIVLQKIAGIEEDPYVRVFQSGNIEELGVFSERVLKIKVLENNPDFPFGLIYPFNKEIFKYFKNIEDLRRSFKWVQIEQNKYKAELTLNGRKVQRVYKLKSKDDVEAFFENRTIEEIEEINKDLMVIVWPNFVAKDWGWYYVFLQKPSKYNELDIEFEPIVADSHNSSSEKDERTHKQWARYFSSKPFLGIEVRKRDASIGLIPIIVEELGEPIQSEPAYVSVDFGTTNTTVAYKKGPGANPEIMNLRNLNKVVVGPQSGWEQISITYFNPVNISFPHPSIASALVHSLGKGDLKPILDAKIKELHESLEAEINMLRGQKEWKLENDLKWSTDHVNNFILAAFLRHLLILIMAILRKEGYDKMKLFAAYPSSLPREKLIHLRDIWRAFVEEIRAKGAFIVELEVRNGNHEWFQTESLAVFKYFRQQGKDQIHLGYNTIGCILDIGGGSTDAAIWMRDQINPQIILLISQNSVRLAGNVILNSFRMRSDETLDVLMGLGIFDEKIVDTIKESPDKENIFLLCFNHKIREIDKRKKWPTVIMSLLNNYTEEVARFRASIAVPLCGVLYYQGLIIRELISNQRFVLNDDNLIVELRFCGNGSKLFRFVFPSEDLNWPGLTYILKESINFRNGKVNVNISFSREPKLEVCKGLLIDQEVKSDENVLIILGESGYKIEQRGKVIISRDLEWNSDLLKDMRDYIRSQVGENRKDVLIRVPDNFKFLSDYLSTFNNAKILPGWEVSYNATQLKQFMEDELSSMKNLENIQPLFIEELTVVSKHIGDFLRRKMN